MKNRKLILDSPFYMFVKKHYCPRCSSVLRTKKVSKIVNSKSAEAKNFDFSHCGDANLYGDVLLTWYVFHCECCGLEIGRKQMKSIEKKKKQQMKDKRT